jgi:DNA polymerase III alpha subunit
MDFLGLRNLSVIKNCIKILRAKYKNIDDDRQEDNAQTTYYREDTKLFEDFIKTMSFNPDTTDQEVFRKVFMTGDTTGIFQFE